MPKCASSVPQLRQQERSHGASLRADSCLAARFSTCRAYQKCLGVAGGAAFHRLSVRHRNSSAGRSERQQRQRPKPSAALGAPVALWPITCHHPPPSIARRSLGFVSAPPADCKRRLSAAARPHHGAAQQGHGAERRWAAGPRPPRSWPRRRRRRHVHCRPRRLAQPPSQFCSAQAPAASSTSCTSWRAAAGPRAP